MKGEIEAIRHRHSERGWNLRLQAHQIHPVMNIDYSSGKSETRVLNASHGLLEYNTLDREDEYVSKEIANPSQVQRYPLIN